MASNTMDGLCFYKPLIKLEAIYAPSWLLVWLPANVSYCYQWYGSVVRGFVASKLNLCVYTHRFSLHATNPCTTKGLFSQI